MKIYLEKGRIRELELEKPEEIVVFTAHSSLRKMLLGGRDYTLDWIMKKNPNNPDLSRYKDRKKYPDSDMRWVWDVLSDIYRANGDKDAEKLAKSLAAIEGEFECDFF